MLFWTEGSRGGSEPLDMSKAEILRGIVGEKLSTAAQEILAVVERTVAGYEEEASGFRREIERQRRQLEVLLQPRVKLEKSGEPNRHRAGPHCPACASGSLSGFTFYYSNCSNFDPEGHEVVLVSEEEEEEEGQTQPSGKSRLLSWKPSFSLLIPFSILLLNDRFFHFTTLA